MVPGSTLNWLTKIPKVFQNHPIASGDPVVGHCFFPCDLSSASGFQHPWHQCQSIITQQEVVQIWPSLCQRFRFRKPQVPSLIFSLRSLLLKICASEQEPLDSQSIYRNVYCVSTRTKGTREKKHL